MLTAAIVYAPLEAPLWPLMNKFYRAHQSSMKASKDAQLWVARQQDIIGGLCLRSMAHGYWLTGLFVAPALRGQGVAGALVKASVCASLLVLVQPWLTKQLIDDGLLARNFPVLATKWQPINDYGAKVQAHVIDKY